MQNLFSKSSNLDVSKNNGTPKSSILKGFSIINHPFEGTPIFGDTHLYSLLAILCHPCVGNAAPVPLGKVKHRFLLEK